MSISSTFPGQLLAVPAARVPIICAGTTSPAFQHTKERTMKFTGLFYKGTICASFSAHFNVCKTLCPFSDRGLKDIDLIRDECTCMNDGIISCLVMQVKENCIHTHSSWTDFMRSRRQEQVQTRAHFPLEIMAT